MLLSLAGLLIIALQGIRALPELSFEEEVQKKSIGRTTKALREKSLRFVLPLKRKLRGRKERGLKLLKLFKKKECENKINFSDDYWEKVKEND